MADGKGLEDIEAGEYTPETSAKTRDLLMHETCDADILVRRAAQIESNYDETTDSFDAMDLKAELLRGVYAYGFERPSAIQQRAIMPVIKGECRPPPPPTA